MERIPDIVLEGSFVRLEPLSMDHLPHLCRVGVEEGLWRYTTTIARSEEEVRRYVEKALQMRNSGDALPFAIVLKATGTVVGCTRFGNIDRDNRRVEIGWTWIGKAWQRTVVNTESKFLLLRYAFEELRTVRVEFKTDALNLQSRAALLRIGAREEGILRRHMVTHDGRMRDTVYFSIIESEWMPTKNRLAGMISSPSSST